MDERKSILRLAKRLRRFISPTQAALVMELTNLRIRARKKFSLADEMFFTQRSLEQASGERLSDYKARRFGQCQNVVDLCCGIGGDAISIARTTTVTGIDKNEVLAFYGQRNLQLHQSNNSRVISGEFETTDLPAV